MPNIKIIQDGYVDHHSGWDGEPVFSVDIILLFNGLVVLKERITNFACAGWRVEYDYDFSETLAKEFSVKDVDDVGVPEHAQLSTLLTDETFCDSINQEIWDFCATAFYNFILAGQGRGNPNEYLSKEYTILPNNILQEVRNA